MPNRALRLAALAAHPSTHPEVAGRIRSSVRRHERRQRLVALAAHPHTQHTVGNRIHTALHNEASRRSGRAL